MADSLVVERAEKKEPFWISYIRGRIRKRKNFFGASTGPTGSGKSYCLLSIAYMLDNTFGPDKIVFGLKGLMKLINSEANYPPGSVFIWDEFQIDAGNRNWQSLANKLLNQLLSTFRHKNFILLISTPYADFIDSQSRKLLHAEFQTMSIDYDKQVVRIKPQLIQYNSRMRKFYYKYLRVALKGRGVAPIKIWNVTKPPVWLVEAYEKMKTDFTSKLNKEIEAQLNKIEVASHDNRKPMTERQNEVLTLMAQHNDVKKVSEILKMTERAVYFHIAMARRKGYTTKDIAKNEEIKEDHLKYGEISEGGE